MRNIYQKDGKVSNSKFDFSLLEPIEDNKKCSKFDIDALEPIEDPSFEKPKEEPQSDKLLKDALIGLFKQRQSLVNTPHDLAKNLEEQGDQFNKEINKTLPLEKYLAGNTPKFKKANIAERLPYEANDYSKLMGETEAPSTLHKIIQKGVEFAPELFLGGQLLTKGAAKIAPNLINKTKDIAGKRQIEKLLKTKEEQVSGIENKLINTEENIQGVEKEAEQLKDIFGEKAGSHLNKGATHEVRGANAIKHRLNQIESYYKTGFKDLKSNLKNSQFEMQDLPSYSTDMQHALTNIKDLKFVNGRLTIANEPEVSRELQSIIDKAPTPKDVKADDFLTKYQDFRDARFDLLQRAKATDSAQERKALFKAYEDSKPIEKTVTDALEQGLGEHSSEFKRLNKGYSEQIFPLRENKTARKALSGQLGANTIKELGGTGKGQELMREIVKQDPELLRNIVGQRYAAKPSALLDIDEATAEYLYEMPELKKIINDFSKQYETKLKSVNAHKEQKKISLKEKMTLENEAKNLKLKLKQIEKDKSKIWKHAKTAGKITAGVVIGTPFVKSMFKKITGQ